MNQGTYGAQKYGAAGAQSRMNYGKQYGVMGKGSSMVDQGAKSGKSWNTGRKKSSRTATTNDDTWNKGNKYSDSYNRANAGQVYKKYGNQSMQGSANKYNNYGKDAYAQKQNIYAAKNGRFGQGYKQQMAAQNANSYGKNVYAAQAGQKYGRGSQASGRYGAAQQRYGQQAVAAGSAQAGAYSRYQR